jgi:hypothetical protein
MKQLIHLRPEELEPRLELQFICGFDGPTNNGGGATGTGLFDGPTDNGGSGTGGLFDGPTNNGGGATGTGLI